MQRRKPNSFKNLKKFRAQFFKSLKLRAEFYVYFDFFFNLKSYFFITSNFLNYYKTKLSAKSKLANEAFIDFQIFDKHFKTELRDPQNCVSSVYKFWFPIFFPGLHSYFSTQQNVLLISDKKGTRTLKDWDVDFQKTSYFSLFSRDFRHFEFGTYFYNSISNTAVSNLKIYVNFLNLYFFTKFLKFFINLSVLFNIQSVKLFLIPYFLLINVNLSKCQLLISFVENQELEKNENKQH
jgi:hypothetical protein